MMADFVPEIVNRINLAETPDFDLGGLRVRPAHREVRMNGEHRELEPKVVKVLVALAAARPGVVSRDRLIEQCWSGRIVGDDALNRCIVALRHLARDFDPEPFAIETVPRVGYYLVERPADVVAVVDRRRKTWTTVSIAVLLALVLLGSALALSPYGLGRADAAPASIAVMPFRNLSSGEPYFAEGIGEEIIGQLAREPQFRVAGTTSSSEWGNDPDIREVGQRLNVDYVLKGSVRRQGDQVRVNAGLMRASDGARIWSDSYDGKLDDIFAIQQRIGGAIAGELRRKLVRMAVISGPLVTNGEAYNLYLTARGLLRTRNRRVGVTAAALLREVINLDSGYAPAWASLGTATWLGALNTDESLIAATPQAERYARHALKLAPDLADAHRALGQILGYGNPEAGAHFRRAAELEPNNAESMFYLGLARGAAGEFDQELAAYRRAAELDPLWTRAVNHVAVAVAELGNRAQAEEIVRRGTKNNEPRLHILLGRIAYYSGDFSEAARHWSIVARSDSSRWKEPAQRFRNNAMFAVGLAIKPSNSGSPTDERPRGSSAWAAAAPTPALWQAHNRDRVTAMVHREDNLVAANLMLNARRSRELIAAYESSVGLLGMRPGQALRVDQLGEAPVVALALRQTGRATDADQLLREADMIIRTVYGRGKVPYWFDADAAAIWAAQGKASQALSALERAIARGWVQSRTTDTRDMADEPAFRSLRGQPRFEHIRAMLDALYARERRETQQLRL